MRTQIAVLKHGTWITSQREFNDKREITTGQQCLPEGWIGFFPRIASAHLQQMPKRDALFSQVRNVIDQLREERHHFLVSTRQTTSIQRDPNQSRCIAFGHRLQ